MKFRRVLNRTGFKPIPLYPGFMGIEVDEKGKEAGPINFGSLLNNTAILVFLVFALILPGVLLLDFIETLLGV